MRMLQDGEYEKDFGISKELHEEAYKQAWDSKKFEIENYWKRANYFWLFQAMAFAGYIYPLTSDNYLYFMEHGEILLGVTILGFLTAVAWYLSNLGNKQWQSNWENHIDKLEDSITGPLYKVVSNNGTWSVSKINECVSGFSIFIWILLGIRTIYEFFVEPLAYLAYMLIIGLIVIVFQHYGKGLSDNKKVTFYRREKSN
ncbi:hypothetical protein AGMMS49938_02590 [Fibrobacterales bacterium]|nr:hypothetical protein AGMMS49938_02590 [Fibrobacterales bacterium]